MSTPAWLEHLLNAVDHLADASRKSAAEAEYEAEQRREQRATKKTTKASKQSAGDVGKAFGSVAESCCTAKRYAGGNNE